MAGIIPLPSTRVSGLLVRQRLLAQMQADQLDLFRLQNQVSTGQRITVPSEDAPAARRAMTLQRLLERKTQLASNVKTGQSYLQSTDVALNNVATLLGDIRGVALGVAGTTSTATERQAAIAEVNRAIEQLVSVGNTQFRGRYLFSGSQTNVEPYSFDGNFVQYAGDGKTLSSYSDLGVLFSTSAAGLDVFGGISSEVLGGIDLNPEVTANTPLSTLRGGRGISPNGALQISDGANTVIVDISRATTVGDVARLIEANPPAGRRLTASITGEGLTLQLDASGGSNLTVKEVGSGKAASELGILETTGALINPLVGGDLDPVILKTTRLHELIGSKARARLVSPGNNNDLLIEAAVNGAEYNGVAVQIVDDDLLRANGSVAQGSEYAQYSTTARAASASLKFSGGGNDLIVRAVTAGVAYNNVDIVIGDAGAGNPAAASYDALNKQLTINIDGDVTTIQEVRDAIDATGLFITESDESVEGAASYHAAAVISATDVSNIRGDTGNSGGAANTLYVFVEADVSNANNVAAAINVQGTFTAQLDTLDTTNGSQAGTQPASIDATTVTAGGSGEALDLDSGIRVVSGETTYTLDFSEAETVEDMLNVLNGSDANLYAEINANGSGINLRSRLSGADFEIGENGGETATQLGLRSFTTATRLDQLNYGVGVPSKTGIDYTITSSNLTLTSRDGQTFNIDLSTAITAADAITAINAATGSNVTAEPGEGGHGVKLVDHTVGAGVLEVAQSGMTSGIAGGLAVEAEAVDFVIQSRDGQSFHINVGGAQTIGDVIDLINARTGSNVTAQLATVGNGIELIDNTVGGGSLSVTADPSSEAAEHLGLIPDGQTSVTVVGGTITGSDQNYRETSSVFTTLIRLKDALAANDVTAMERAIEGIDADLDRVTFARSEVGARQQALEVTQQNIEDEDVQLRMALSDEIEVDLVEAISNLTARQISLEASLKTTANIMQLSLLDFI